MTDERRLRWPLRALNRVGRGLARLGLEPGTLEVDAQLDAARAEAGLDDFGDPRFLEPFQLLCDDLGDLGDGLNLLGRFGLLRDFRRHLVNRLRIQAIVAKHPAIADETLAPPIFIIGPPRTGTTLLHNLMARIPDVRVPWLWEMLEPVPHELGRPREPDPRKATAQRFQAEAEHALPMLQKAHPLVWDWPDECLWLFANSFMSEMYLARFSAPRYRELIEQGSWDWAFAEYIEQLKILQWQTRREGPPPQWILKAPGHNIRLRALLDHFPHARFIRTHRDPRVTIASCCSLFEIGHLAANHRVDLDRLGRDILSTWVDNGQNRLAALAPEIAPERCFDVGFAELLRDPFAAIRRAYDHFGLELGDTTAMRAWLADNPRHKQGKHTYSLERYGISEAEALARSEPYRRQFADYL